MPDNSPGGSGAVWAASRLFVDSGTVLTPGAIAVSEGLVIAAGSPGDVARSVPRTFRWTEYSGGAILPGLVNAHAHLQIPPLPGRPGEPPGPPPSFAEWILRLVAWKRAAPPEEFRRNFEAAAREALASGTTSAGEIAGPDISAYASCPLRARVFAEGIGFLPSDAGPALAAVEAALGRLGEISPSMGAIAAGVSPHTLYTAGPALLRSLGALAARLSLPVCIHLAESAAEMEFLGTGTGEFAARLYPGVGKDVSWFKGIGMTIPAYLAEAGLLREGLILVHNVRLSREEIRALAARGARFVLCPRSNAAHGNGSPDVSFFADAGIPFALGTDSRASVPSLSMWDEIREARSLYRGAISESGICRILFRAATSTGAAALGFAGGTLRPGSPADFIVVDDPGGEGAGAALRNLVERGCAGSVRRTVVAGRSAFERRG